MGAGRGVGLNCQDRGLDISWELRSKIIMFMGSRKVHGSGTWGGAELPRQRAGYFLGAQK